VQGAAVVRERLVQLLAQGRDVGERGTGGQDGRDGEPLTELNRPFSQVRRPFC
jgi:hypothetical protein